MDRDRLVILAIDDRQDNLLTLKAILEDALPGVLLLTATGGRSGIALAMSENPDVILLDILMPEMDGFEVCRLLKNDPALQMIPVFFLTALHSDREVRYKALLAGAEGFLSKPIDEIELTAQILTMARMKQGNLARRSRHEELERIVDEKTRELKQEIRERKAIEITLLESEGRYRALFDLAGVAIGYYKPDGTTISFNRKAAENMGGKPEDFEGKSIYELFPKEDADRYMSRISQSLSSTEEKMYEDCISLLPDEGDRWFHSTFTCIADSRGDIAGVQIISQDITDRKQLEKQMQQSEERFQKLFHEAPLAYQCLDAGGHFVEINRQWLDTLGYERQEVLGKWFGDFLAPEYVVGFLQRFPEFLTLAKSRSEFEMVHKNGSRIYIDFEWKTSICSDGKSRQTHCILQNITEMKRVEQELNESRSLINAIVKSTTDIIYVKDTLGNYKMLNEAAEIAFGKNMAEIRGANDFALHPPWEAQAFMERDRQIMESGTIRTLEESMTDVHGKTSTFLSTKGPLYDENHVLKGLFGISRDITERKAQEENLVHLSFYDYLTGLYNRRFFEEELHRLDTKRNYPMTIAMGDVNGLKLVNDSFGHASGDEVLQKIARAMKLCCRADDIMARLGGDEFAIIFPKTETVKAEAIISRIQKVLANEKVDSMAISISFGYETKYVDDDSTHDILKHVEDHMYRQKLHESLSLRSKAINLAMNTLFEKSNREMMHSKRVSELCEKIAIALDLDADVIKDLRTAGLMHDIGKIGIADQILNKPRRLDEDEWKEIHRHPEIGFRILSAVNEFSEIAGYVLEHHERWDGRGYPRGLKEDEICLHARIIAIADSYDAMTSFRPYGKSKSPQEAIEEIRACANIQFDPVIARIFVEKVLQQELPALIGEAVR